METEVRMPTATSEDTEITLGTGKMLALFFGLVALCAVFFAAGFSLGKTSVLKPSAAEVLPQPPAAIAMERPSAVKTTNAAADATDKTADAQTPGPSAASGSDPQLTAAADTSAPATDPSAPPVLNGYYVQVAAVSKQEDADALVDALKKKQYPAFAANTASDKLFHVQCGPYADIKEAEALRTKLTNDGYNPILKK
jgi:DedD protein